MGLGYGAVGGVGVDGMLRHARGSEKPRLAVAAAACTAMAVAFVMLAGAQPAAVPVSLSRSLPSWATEWSHEHAAGPRGATATRTAQLLGFDPFRSNSLPGKNSNAHSTTDAFEADDDEKDPLPSWATEWSEENHNSCEVGAQCDHGSIVNPLGSVGRWVMIKTSSHWNSPYDEYRRHKCENLPGWALEECHRMRDKESGLDEQGNNKDGSEAKGMPIMLQQQYRMHPALLRSLPSRWQHMRRQHVSLARNAKDLWPDTVIGKPQAGLKMGRPVWNSDLNSFGSTRTNNDFLGLHGGGDTTFTHQQQAPHAAGHGHAAKAPHAAGHGHAPQGYGNPDENDIVSPYMSVFH